MQVFHCQPFFVWASFEQAILLHRSKLLHSITTLLTVVGSGWLNDDRWGDVIAMSHSKVVRVRLQENLICYLVQIRTRVCLLSTYGLVRCQDHHDSLFIGFIYELLHWCNWIPKTAIMMRQRHLPKNTQVVQISSRFFVKRQKLNLTAVPK